MLLMNARDFIKKHVSNVKYGRKIMAIDSERLAHFLADRAAQYSMNEHEIKARLNCLFPYEFINRVCVLTQQIYEMTQQIYETLEGEEHERNQIL